MSIKFRCPECAALLSARDEDESKTIKCPRCAAAVKVEPLPEPPPAPRKLAPGELLFLRVSSLACGATLTGMFALVIFRLYRLPSFDLTLIPFYIVIVFTALVLALFFFPLLKRTYTGRIAAPVLLAIVGSGLAGAVLFTGVITYILLRVFGRPEFAPPYVAIYAGIQLLAFFTFVFFTFLGRLVYEIRKFLKVRVSSRQFLRLLWRQVRMMDIFLLGKA